MPNILRNRVAAVAAGATIIAVVGAGGAVAAAKITGHDVKNGSLTGADIKNKSLEKVELSDRAVEQLRGQQGPAGEPGPAGPAGPAGQSLVADETTAPNASYGGVRVVDVSSDPATSGGPTTSTGAQLVEPVELQEGTYLVTSTVQFFDFGPTASGNDEDYGVARLFLDGDTLGTSWSPQVPDDGNNAAQAAGTIVVTVPAGGGTLTARALLRGGDAGQAGGNLIVTRLDGAAAAPTAG